MAYTRKTSGTTSKPKTTKAKTKTTKVETKEVETEPKEVEVETKKVESKPKKKFEPSDPVNCRSVTQGRLFMEGMITKMTYQWIEYGDIAEVEYRDLAAAVRSNSSYIFRPFIIVDNDDFIAEFPALSKFYSEKLAVQDFNEILVAPLEEMKGIIETLPNGAKEQVLHMATAKIGSGELDSVKRIKMLEEVFDVDFNLLVDLAK